MTYIHTRSDPIRMVYTHDTIRSNWFTHTIEGERVEERDRERQREREGERDRHV